ncbi:MAG: cytochrome b N-terminal domain-containing protein, partial [Thermoanaerobaculia bacterium]
HKEIPLGGHSTVWYYFGGVSLFFFTVQIVTGILLLMNYQVGENTSYESMKYLVGHVPFGWLVRSIHCWSAHLMSLAVLVHLFSILFVKAYRKPRELTWYSGFLMLGLVLGFGFSGYLLPWNELSYFATAVGTDSVKSVPVVGPWLLRVMRGGEEVSVQTLYRFFALHVCILPLVIAGVLGVHLLFIQRQGMAEPLGHEGEAPRGKGLPFFPNFAIRDLLLWVLCLNLLAILAVILPYGPGIPGMEWALGDKANPLKPAYPGIKPEWYFLWVYQMLREFPAHLFGMEGPQACLLLSTVLMGIAFFVPLLDRNAARNKPSPLFTDLGVAGLLFIGLLTLKAWDIGVAVPKGKDPAADPALAAVIARTAAIWILGLGLAVSAIRRWRFRHTAFAFTAAVLLQALLNGFAHMSWLAAGAVSAAALVLWALFRYTRRRGAATAAAFLIAMPLAIPSPARAEEKAAPAAPSAATTSAPAGHVAEAGWPEEFRKLYLAEEKGKPLVSEKARARFRDLPSHAQELFFSAAASGFLASPAHLATLLALDLDDRKVELLLSDNCVLCHSNPDMPDEILFRIREDRSGPQGHLDLSEIVSDVHFRKGLMCSGCHGGKPSDKDMSPEIYKRWPASKVRSKDRSWIPGFCARCHSSSEFMRSYNPKLPVDQLAKYQTSRHGELLLQKRDPKAAQCISCHGVHGIRGPDSPASLVYPENIPATCGRCHASADYMKGYTLPDGKPLPTNQLELYRQSVHGIALLKKHDAGAPACNGCHGNHAALQPETAFVSQVCRNCHAGNATLFDGSPHKKAFEKNRWPECATCHNNHLIEPPADAMMKPGNTGLCVDCHKKFGKPICIETASFFYTTVTGLAGQSASLGKEVNRLAERGFDVDDLRFQAGSVNDALQKTRLAIHTFDRSDFLRNSEAAARSIEELRGGTAKVWAEYRYRRNGLLLATALISLFALLLFAKIRQVDRKTGFKR